MSHVDNYILMLNLLIGVLNSAEDIIELIAINGVMELKYSTFYRVVIFGGPPVTTIWYYNPEIHAESTTTHLINS